MECYLKLSEEQWKLLLEMLQHEHSELSSLIRRSESSGPRHALHDRRDMIDQVLRQVEDQVKAPA